MSTTYQIIYWRDIPAQVRLRSDKGRYSQPLSMRFQKAIDAAAMRAGVTGTDQYLQEWRSSDWQPKKGDPELIAASLVAELEAEYPPERLESLLGNNGFE
jgi:hypothetical protein